MVRCVRRRTLERSRLVAKSFVRREVLSNAAPTKPLYIISPSSSSSTSFPPAGALLPPKQTLQILKRPSSASSNSSSTSGSTPHSSNVSLKDREKAYEEARRRIMGGGETKKEELPKKGKGEKVSTPFGVLRQPRAPPTEDGPGFGKRPGGGSNGERRM